MHSEYWNAVEFEREFGPFYCRKGRWTVGAWRGLRDIPQGIWGTTQSEDDAPYKINLYNSYSKQIDQSVDKLRVRSGLTLASVLQNIPLGRRGSFEGVKKSVTTLHADFGSHEMKSCQLRWKEKFSFRICRRLEICDKFLQPDFNLKTTISVRLFPFNLSNTLYKCITAKQEFLLQMPLNLP